MKWILTAVVVVAGTFVGTFYSTHNTWSATNAAGVVALANFIAYVYWITRTSATAKQRRWTRGVAAAVIAGTTFFWLVMYSTTNWQHDTLHVIHKVIFHGVSMDMLKTRGIRTLSAYAAQSSPKKLSIGEVFRKEAVYVNRDSSILEYGPDNEYRLFAASVTDTQVVLVSQWIRPIHGEDRQFKNFDGRQGMAQDHLVLTRRGMVYEHQN